MFFAAPAAAMPARKGFKKSTGNVVKVLSMHVILIRTCDSKVNDGGQSPAEPAGSPLAPDTDCLVLVGQVEAVPVVVVVRPHAAKLGAKEVLGAALGRQGGMVA